MNKKIEPPQKTLPVRVKKQDDKGNLIPLEDLDYLLDNLICKKKKTNNETPQTNITSNVTSSTATTNATTQTTTPNKVASKDETSQEDSKKVTTTTTVKAKAEVNDKKHVITKEENTDENNKKVKVEEKKEVKKPKRKKVFQACVVCRKSHISCDNKRPCTRCVKKGIAHLCHDAPKKGSNMMDCNSCPIFPLLKGPYPFHPNLSRPPTFPSYSTDILNSQLNPSPLVNFPIPLLNQHKLNSYPPPPPNGIPAAAYPGLNANPLLLQSSSFLQQKPNPALGANINQTTTSLQSSFHNLKQAIQNQQTPHPITPSITQQPTPPLTNLSTLTPPINNVSFPLTANSSIVNTETLTNNIAVANSISQPSSRQNSIHTPSTDSLSSSLISPVATVTSPALQTIQQALQTNSQIISSPHIATPSSKSQVSMQEIPSTSSALSTTLSEMNTNNTTTTTDNNTSQLFNNILSHIESPHYSLPNLEFNPSVPCVPFSSVTPFFTSDYMNNEFSALVNFCQNVSHENGMPSRCKNCPFSRTEQFFLKAADNSSPNISIEDQLVDIIKEKYKAGLLKPYNYSKGYLRLQKYLDENISIINKQKILNAFNTFQKGFKAAAASITDWDLLSSEESFERLLLEYDRVFASVGIPSCLWRRTGEIFKANRHFAYLVGVPIEKLNGGKMSIYEFMTEDFVANYWEKYSIIAFDTKQKAVITSCVLENPQSFKRSIKCAFSFTVRRDKFEIPSAIIGNFMPYNPQLIYKDPFSTNSLGLLGFLSPYSTPSYNPLPRGEDGYNGCGCTGTQCCTNLKKEITVKKMNSSGGCNHHDHDDFSHDDHQGGAGRHDHSHCHSHNHDHDYEHDHSNDHDNDHNHINNNNDNNSNNNVYTHTQNYTTTSTATTTSIKVNSGTDHDSFVCPKDSKENFYCSQCEMSSTCNANNNNSCGDQCTCNTTEGTDAQTAPTTTTTTKATNDPVVNEFMNLDMNAIYPSSNPVVTKASSVPLMLMNNRHNMGITNNLPTTTNPLAVTTASINSFINLNSALQSINANLNQNLTPNDKHLDTTPSTVTTTPQQNQQQLQQQQLEQLQQVLQQKIMNQNKENNLPELPADDIRNELPEDLLFSILNSK